MRKYQLIAVSIALLLAFAAPAAAQSNAVHDQYAQDGVTCIPDRSNVNCVSITGIEDSVEAVTEDSARKAKAAGAALSGDALGSENNPERDSGTSSGDDPHSGGEAGPEDDAGTNSGSTDEGDPVSGDSSVARTAGIERLPDTGGASLLMPGAGLLLVAAGLPRSARTR